MRSKIDITVDCSVVSAEYASNNRLVEVTIVDVEIDDIIGEIGVNSIMEQMTTQDIVDFVNDNDIDITA